MSSLIANFEPSTITEFRKWLAQNGALIHLDVLFKKVSGGFSVVAKEDLAPDSTIVSCPFSLAITLEISSRALALLFEQHGCTDNFKIWSERQLICSYICMHWVIGQFMSPPCLAHWPYFATLPSPDDLRTPLHFTPSELEAFKGTNLYGATLDRQRILHAEWQQCYETISAANATWGNEFTWGRYLAAATYLSSRAFPSTLLSATPTLMTTESSHPVLLPGVDALNHARAHPVSWVVSSASADTEQSGYSATSTDSISLVIHTSTTRGAELFNNYGPKPNAELILGYGFSLPHNPDDTIVLKIGGAAQGTWEVGRGARNAEPLWDAVLAAVSGGVEPAERSIEDELDAADMLAEMVENLYDRLPQGKTGEMRKEVAIMLEHYLEGQRDILQSVSRFTQEKKQRAIANAREQGLQIVDEEEDEEDER
ncbi:SET domain-containing protein [Wolfiporia cocos MD-104 SS10]|uniref:SET domain-containing protein n=1 Tax=Wolfiporia cocos (strain MD-104) TaxID=742152 RepID=A0A2H3JLA7_WOLCO|nr:SET domain-containing protein [Wolfiporia cocos MD-104 SS10]